MLLNSEHKISVEYRNMKKCVKLLDTDDLNGALDLAFINSPIKLPSTYVLQYFDNDIEDFIDLDNLEVLETHRKIKIVLVEDCEEQSFAPDSSANNAGTNVSDCESSADLDTAADLDTTAFDLETSADVSLNNHTYISWPHPFIIKDNMIRPSTLRLLEGKCKMSVSAISSLFISIFDETVKYTL